MATGPDYILLKKIALRIKKIREEKQLSQEDVINDTGIHVGRIETGKKDFSVSTLKKLCKYFNISISDFFKGIK